MRAFQLKLVFRVTSRPKKPGGGGTILVKFTSFLHYFGSLNDVSQKGSVDSDLCTSTGGEFTSSLLAIHLSGDFPKIEGGGDPKHHFQLECP